MRVIKYVRANIVPQVRGRVIEVPVEEGNRPVKKGDVLFRIDPTPYQLQVNALEAQLANAQGSRGELEEQLTGRRPGGQAKIAIEQASRASRSVGEGSSSRASASSRTASSSTTGAGNRFDLEQAETDAHGSSRASSTARAAPRRRPARPRRRRSQRAPDQAALGAKVNGEYAQVAQVRAQLEKREMGPVADDHALAPANGYAINLQLRPGSMSRGLPRTPGPDASSRTSCQVVALYHQNELHQVEPGNEAEIALETYPGRIIKAKVDSIVWAQGQGQSAASATLPTTGAMPVQPRTASR